MPRSRQQPEEQPEPGSGIGSGSVTEGTGSPSGYYWDRLEEAGNDEDALKELDGELAKHGYDPDGQLRQTITDRLAGED